MVIGDVFGKVVPAAVLMASTLSVPRAVAQREAGEGAPALGRVLTEANEVLCTIIHPTCSSPASIASSNPRAGA
jgi:serine phosphatase RsbU (regulator of sigma subunit)